MMGKKSEPSLSAGAESVGKFLSAKALSSSAAYRSLVTSGMRPIKACTLTLARQLRREFLTGLGRGLLASLLVSLVSAFFAYQAMLDLPQWLDLLFRKAEAWLGHARSLP